MQCRTQNRRFVTLGIFFFEFNFRPLVMSAALIDRLDLVPKDIRECFDARSFDTHDRSPRFEERNYSRGYLQPVVDGDEPGKPAAARD